MKNLARIENGVVTNVFTVEDADVAAFPGCVDVAGAAVGKGYTYDGAAFAPPAASALRKVYTYATFLAACEDAEIDALLTAKRGNGAAAVKIERFLLKAQARDSVDCNTPVTQQAFADMVARGILTQARADILMGV